MRRIYTREAPWKCGFAKGGIEGGGRLYVALCAVLVLLVGTQARAAALSNEVHRAPGPPVVVQDDSFTFSTTAVGQTSIECRGVCFCDAANCMCENSSVPAIAISPVSLAVRKAPYRGRAIGVCADAKNSLSAFDSPSVGAQNETQPQRPGFFKRSTNR